MENFKWVPEAETIKITGTIVNEHMARGQYSRERFFILTEVRDQENLLLADSCVIRIGKKVDEAKLEIGDRVTMTVVISARGHRKMIKAIRAGYPRDIIKH